MKSRLGGKYSSKKYFSTSERNTPEYKLWRLAVYQRDKFACKKCGKKLSKGRKIQAHHIRRWSDFPELRYNVNNGITLCWDCHKIMFDNEEAYVQMCITLLSNKEDFVRVQRMLHEERRKDNGEYNDSKVHGD